MKTGLRGTADVDPPTRYVDESESATGGREASLSRPALTGSFETQIVKKRQRRLTGVDEIVLSFYAKGSTIGKISARFAEISWDLAGVSVSKESISRITDKVMEEMTDWANRPLGEELVYAPDESTSAWFSRSPSAPPSSHS